MPWCTRTAMNFSNLCSTYMNEQSSLKFIVVFVHWDKIHGLVIQVLCNAISIIVFYWLCTFVTALSKKVGGSLHPMVIYEYTFCKLFDRCSILASYYVLLIIYLHSYFLTCPPTYLPTYFLSSSSSLSLSFSCYSILSCMCTHGYW